MPTYEYVCESCGGMEIFHSIMDEAWEICPECKLKGLTRLISCGGGVIIGGREANQYNDIRRAKYWRDKNGIRHKVTAGDGHSKSPTVTHQSVSSEEVERRKKITSIRNKKKRSQISYSKYKNNVFREKKQ